MVDASPASWFRSGLFTDLYELTMAQAYDAEGMDQSAVFELFFRKMPVANNYFVAAGLEDVLSCLESWQITEDDLAYLDQQRLFSEAFLCRLRNVRFTGEVHAMPEGTLVFPGEPLVQVVAPILEAQLIETIVLNHVHFQTVAATKATRVVQAGSGRTIVEFGSRRAHGIDAALKVARTSYLAGAAGTSNALAGKVYGIPIWGTMAHSYIQAHDSEAEAFEAFARQFPETTLLVDTYDTLAGVRKVIDLSQKLGERFHVRSIRLDSGDLGDLAFQARQMLDSAGLQGVRIFASSGLDEYEVARLVASGAPIDAFGVGTSLAVAEGASHLDMAYKLVEYAGRPRLKLSSRKVLYPGRKQVFRRIRNGVIVGDLISRHDETPAEADPLLRLVLRGGKRLGAGRATLEEAREHACRERERLPESLRSLDQAAVPYTVEISAALKRDLESYRKQFEDRPVRVVKISKLAH